MSVIILETKEVEHIRICELNNVTHDHTGNKDHLVEDQSYIYSGAEASEICVLSS